MRHLLIEVDDPGAKTLSRLDNGVRSVIATGTLYEMDERAMSLVEEWGTKEGFKYRGHNDPPAWECLRDIIVLTKIMGHTTLYDATNRPFPVPIPLDHWQGCKDKNGDDYQYGYTGTTIEACPRVTSQHGINMTPATNEELLAEMRKAITIRKALGPERKFILD